MFFPPALSTYSAVSEELYPLLGPHYKTDVEKLHHVQRKAPRMGHMTYKKADEESRFIGL